MDNIKEGKSKSKAWIIVIAIVYILIVLAVVILFILPLIRGKKGNFLIEEKLSLGQKYLSEMEYDKAVAAFSDVIKVDDKNLTAYLGLGKAYSKLEKWQEAADSYNEVISIDDKNTEAYIGLGDAYAGQEEWGIAVEGYNNAIGTVMDLVLVDDSGNADADFPDREKILSDANLADSEYMTDDELRSIAALTGEDNQSESEDAEATEALSYSAGDIWEVIKKRNTAMKNDISDIKKNGGDTAKYSDYLSWIVKVTVQIVDPYSGDPIQNADVSYPNAENPALQQEMATTDSDGIVQLPARNGGVVTLTISVRNSGTMNADIDVNTDGSDTELVQVLFYPDSSNTALRNDDKIIEVGDTYIFGTYEQDNDTTNGAEDIEWIVLDKEGDRILLISKYVLARWFYDTELTDVTWETCSLREWLKVTFKETAFSADEAEQIVTSAVSAEENSEYSTNPGNDTRDQIFLLSISEAEAYFGSSEDRKCKPTESAGAQEVYTKNSDGCCWWWLRSPGSRGTQAAFVNIDGSVSYIGGTVTNGPFGVRPALWITVTEQTEKEPPDIEVGDTYTFGTYEQDNDTSNGAENIEWIVLDKDGDRFFLLSKYALDCPPYNSELMDVTWETCSLRKWLNGTFMDMAFSTDEVAQIATSTVSADGNPEYDTDPGNDTEDQVFLLSISEAETYFESEEDRMCKPTAYAISQGVYESRNGCCWWWLRSPGSASSHAAGVRPDGSAHNHGVHVYEVMYGVRPALWIKP